MTSDASADSEVLDAMFDMGRMFGSVTKPEVHEFSFGGFKQRVQVLTHDDDKSEGSTFSVQGYYLWHSAPVLAKHIEDCYNRCKEHGVPVPTGSFKDVKSCVDNCLGPVFHKAWFGTEDVRIAELGSGAGLTGIALAQMVGHKRPENVHVLLTDYDDEVVKLLEENVVLNKDAACSCSVATLDWREALHEDGLDKCSTIGKEWLHSCDAVVAADVTHRTDLYNALFACAAELLSPGQPFLLVSGIWRYTWELIHPAAESAGLTVQAEIRDDSSQTILSLFTKN